MEPLKKEQTKKLPTFFGQQIDDASSSAETERTVDEKSVTTTAAKKTGSTFLINSHHANHAYPLVQQMIINNPGWKETISKDKWHMSFLWHNTPDEEIMDILLNQSGKIINRYPFVQYISRKDNTQLMMSICQQSEHADLYDFVPRTFNFPQDAFEFDKYQAANKKATFIAKPQGGCMGDGICVFKDIKNVPAHTSKDGMIVQRYISNPLLLNGFKFDLRVYVVVTGISDGNMHAFLHDEGLVRCCTEPYEKPTKDNYRKSYMHLTNYSVNKSSKTYIQEDEVGDILEPNECSKRTLTALWKQLGDEEMVETIKTNISDTCAATMSMLSNFMQVHVNPQNPDKQPKYKSKVYQIFGFDILIDKNLKAWLLEINDHPSMQTFFCQQSMGCNHAKNGCPTSRVDMHVKGSVQEDSIKMLRSKTAVKNRDSFKGLNRIFPSEETHHQEMYEMLADLRHLYARMTNGKYSMSSGDFERKMYAKPIVKKQLQRVDLTICFQQATGNQKSIDFYVFPIVIKALMHKLKYEGNLHEFIAELE